MSKVSPSVDHIRCMTLVHCMVGASRSTTLVIAYLVVEEGWTLLDAWRHCRSRRSVARPNKGFASQLIALEAETRAGGKSTATMSDFGYT